MSIEGFIDGLGLKWKHEALVAGVNAKDRITHWYVDANNLIPTLTSKKRVHVVLKGPRGSGKSLAFSVAAEKITQSRRSSLPLILDCFQLGEEIKKTLRDLESWNENDRRSSRDFYAEIRIILHLLGAMRRQQQYLDLAGYKGQRARQFRKMSAATAKMQSKVESLLREFEASVQSARQTLKGARLSDLPEVTKATSIIEASKNEGAQLKAAIKKIDKYSSGIRGKVDDAFREFAQSIRKCGFKEVFIFLDDVCEMAHDFRVLVIKLLEGLLKKPEAAGITFYRRYGCYSTDQSAEQAVGAAAHVHPIYSDPVVASLSQYHPSLSRREARAGAYLKTVVEFHLNLNGVSFEDVFNVGRDSVDDFYTKLFICCPTARDLSRVMSQIYAEEFPVNIGYIQRFGAQHWPKHISSLLALDYHDQVVGETDSNEEKIGLPLKERQLILKTFNFLTKAAAENIIGKKNFFLEDRYFAVSEEDVFCAAVLCECGILYPVNRLTLAALNNRKFWLLAINGSVLTFDLDKELNLEFDELTIKTSADNFRKEWEAFNN